MDLPRPRPTRPAAGALRRAGRRPRLVALGDVVLDIVTRPESPIISGSDVAGVIRFRVGGSAANACRAFAREGGAATFIGAVGDDQWGRRLAAALRRDGVSVRVAKVSAPTARLVAVVEPSGERSFVTQRGAADRLTAAHLRRAWPAGLDVLHLPAYSLLAEPLAGASRAAIERARAAEALISLDLASRGPLLAAGRGAALALLDEVAPHMVLANADEVAALAGRQAPRRLLRSTAVLVIKEGPAGCRLLWRAGGPQSAADADVLELDVATRPIDVTDTTGAGDAFDAGFLHALIELSRTGRDWYQPQVLRRAAVAGHRAAARLLSGPRPELDL